MTNRERLHLQSLRAAADALRAAVAFVRESDEDEFEFDTESDNVESMAVRIDVLASRLESRAAEATTATDEERQMERYQDPADPLNGAEYHTGKACIEPGCDNPAGTAWSPHWCQPCNAARVDRISAQLESLTAPQTGGGDGR